MYTVIRSLQINNKAITSKAIFIAVQTFIIISLALGLAACGSKQKTKNASAGLSPTLKLHRAIFSQDPERVAFAINKGANVNELIKRSQHRSPSVEMTPLRSTPLNAVIADYKYHDSLFVAPLKAGQNSTDRALEIINLLVQAGINFNTLQFHPEYKGPNTGGTNYQGMTFEIGGSRLAAALPLLMRAGLTPTTKDIQMAYTHYNSLVKTISKNEEFLPYLMSRYDEFPRSFQKMIDRANLELEEMASQAKALEAKQQAQVKSYEAMQQFAKRFQTNEEFSKGQKACYFVDHLVTVGFIEKYGDDKSVLRTIYSYRYSDQGVDRRSKERSKRGKLTLNSTDLSLCPADAF